MHSAHIWVSPHLSLSMLLETWIFSPWTLSGTMLLQGTHTMSGQQNITSRSVPPTILVVDDELTVTKLCKTILQQAGFSVLNADGSSEALKICTQHEGRIDLLLTDLILPPPGFQLASSTNQFPHVHGHELAVRALHIRKDLRIVLMSGNIDQDLAGYGIRRGALPFLPKPFEHQALVALVQQTLHAPPPSIESLTASPPENPTVGDGWVD
jgi:CheY-like chemotaxis protein